MTYALDPLREDELHVWHGTAPVETTYPDWAMLSAGERARWRRLRTSRAANYASSHAATRRILGRYLATPATLVNIDRAACMTCGRIERGRPIVHTGGEPLWFSLSHSGSDWLLAVGRQPIGVDVEGSRPLDVEALSDLALSDTERQTIRRHEPQHRAGLFFRCWTRKEAIFKATGGSRFADLAKLDVDPGSDADVVVTSPSPKSPGQLRIRTLNILPGSYVAVAGPAEISGRIVAREWPTGQECAR